jgi:hypothetical protein
MAASTTPLDGKIYLVEISTDAGTTWKQLGYQNECNLNNRQEFREITSKTQCDYREKLPTIGDWSVSGTVQFYHGTSGSSNYQTLLGTKGTTFLVKLKPVDCGDAIVGELQFQGTCFWTELSNVFPVNETASYSYTFEGTGTLSVTVTA